MYIKLITGIFLVCSGLVKAQSSAIDTADSLYFNGNYSKAIAIYETAETPKTVYDKMAKAYVAIGNYDKALEFYSLNIEAYPDDALSKYEYAKLLSKTKNFDKSIAQFNDLIKIDDRNPNYQYEMGLALEQLKDSTAFNRFLMTFELDNTHQKAIFKIAKHYLIKRKHELSHQFIDKGLENYENNLELISLKAQNYYHQQYYKEAKPWFLKLIELGESSEFIHEKLSMIYAAFSEFDNAIEQRKLALKYNPTDANGIFVLGTYYRDMQNYEEAEKYYLQALKLQDKPLDYEYQSLGFVLNRQNKFQEAIAAFKKAVRENPENNSAKFYVVTTKDAFYSDIDAKIKLYEDFIKETPEEEFTVYFAKRRLKELKEEKFTSSETPATNTHN